MSRTAPVPWPHALVVGFGASIHLAGAMVLLGRLHKAVDPWASPTATVLVPIGVTLVALVGAVRAVSLPTRLAALVQIPAVWALGVGLGPHQYSTLLPGARPILRFTVDGPLFVTGVAGTTVALGTAYRHRAYRGAVNTARAFQRALASPEFGRSRAPDDGGPETRPDPFPWPHAVVLGFGASLLYAGGTMVLQYAMLPVPSPFPAALMAGIVLLGTLLAMLLADRARSPAVGLAALALVPAVWVLPASAGPKSICLHHATGGCTVVGSRFTPDMFFPGVVVGTVALAVVYRHRAVPATDGQV